MTEPAETSEPPVSPALRTLVRALDDALEVPVLGVRFGLDPVLGLLAPGVGDALTGVASLWLVGSAVGRVPPVILGKMLLNIAVDALVGAVPVLGDMFDVAWKSNRRNLELLEQHVGGRLPARAVDYLAVGGAAVLVVAAVTLPVVVLWWLGSAVVGALTGSG